MMMITLVAILGVRSVNHVMVTVSGYVKWFLDPVYTIQPVVKPDTMQQVVQLVWQLAVSVSCKRCLKDRCTE